jgi:hypothetical protein
MVLTARLMSWRIVLASLLAVPATAAGQGHEGTPRPLAHAAARMARDLAVRGVFVDERWSRAMVLPAPGVELRVEREQSVARGLFVEADAESVTLDVSGARHRVARAEVRRVAMATGTRQKRHETIGVVAGAIVGAFIMGRRCGWETSGACSEEAMLHFGGPMLAGGMIGHVLPAGVAWREIYVRPRTSPDADHPGLFDEQYRVGGI